MAEYKPTNKLKTMIVQQTSYEKLTVQLKTCNWIFRKPLKTLRSNLRQVAWIYPKHLTKALIHVAEQKLNLLRKTIKLKTSSKMLQKKHMIKLKTSGLMFNKQLMKNMLSILRHVVDIYKVPQDYFLGKEVIRPYPQHFIFFVA